ncbi:MAG TPA: sigma-70 family RNA polymerase sigma factor [Planctomycetota bacterium]|nr:sigma-70 family RNA polymerase sigma factor [Planctomycetota bacterium]
MAKRTTATTPRSERSEALARLAGEEWESWIARARALLGGGAVDAPDAVQEAVVRALDRMESLRSDESLRGWFESTLQRVCSNRRRRRAWEATRVRPLENAEADDAGVECGRAIGMASAVAEPIEILSDSDSAARVRSAMAALEEPIRVAMEAYWLHDEPVDRIGAELGLSKTGVWKRLRRGASVLRERLGSPARGLDR